MELLIIDRNAFDQCPTPLMFEHFRTRRATAPERPANYKPGQPTGFHGPFEFSKRAKPTKRIVGPIEEGWINLQPHFEAKVVEHDLPTIDTIAPHPLTAFIERATNEAAARDEEILHIEKTACCRYHINGGTDLQHRGTIRELETVADELARAGISSFSVSSSPPNASADDELEAANIAEDHLGITPYEVPDPALVRRIEWERFIFECGPATRLMLVKDPKTSNATIIATRDRVTTGKPVLPLEGKDAPPADQLLDAARKIAKATEGAPLGALLAARERAAFYGGIGSLLYGITKQKGFQPFVTADFADSGAEDFADPDDEPDGGPKELGIDEFQTPNEPDEPRLWPVSVREIATTILRGLRLSRIETEWLDENPEALDELRSIGLGSYL